VGYGVIEPHHFVCIPLFTKRLFPSIRVPVRKPLGWLLRGITVFAVSMSIGSEIRNSAVDYVFKKNLSCIPENHIDTIEL
jgi:hypothetical protein